jgi:hypothetical protein
MHRLEDATLAKYRAAVDDPVRGATLAAIVEGLDAAYQVGGSFYKRVPAPYAADHPRAELLRHNGLHAAVHLPCPPRRERPPFRRSASPISPT